MKIEFRDDGRYSATGIGIVTFLRESASPLRLKDVMFIPGLNKNLMFVVVLEDYVYDVNLRKGKGILRHIHRTSEEDRGSIQEPICT